MLNYRLKELGVSFLYKIGDSVFYPLHGAGIIRQIEEKRILGERHKYYIVRIPIKDTEVMLPIENAESLGVRAVKSSEEIDELLSYMKKTADESSDNWNRRYRENIEKIREGTQERTAEVVKYLLIRDENKGLSSSEKKTLNYAKQILYSEIIMAKNMDYDAVDKMIKEEYIK